MALLLRARDGRWVNLGARTLVGRYPHCDLQLLDRRVSGHHATLLFQDGTWWIRARQTTNGTLFDGAPLAAGESRELRVGTELRFGTTRQTWSVTDTSPPTLALVPTDGSAVPVALDRWATPDGRVRLSRDGEHWMRHDDSGRRRVDDGELVESGDEVWTVLLPANLRGGSSHTEAALEGRVHLALRVSEDGDRVHQCTLVLDGARHDLTVRRHTHLLVELADARRDDPDDGWVEASVVQRRLGLSPSQLHLYTHRARAQVRAAGLPEDRMAIEVRGERGARQLRLGVGAVVDTQG